MDQVSIDSILTEQQKLETQFQCLLTLQNNNQHGILYTSKTFFKQRVLSRACNPSTSEAEAGGEQVSG